MAFLRQMIPRMFIIGGLVAVLWSLGEPVERSPDVVDLRSVTVAGPASSGAAMSSTATRADGVVSDPAGTSTSGHVSQDTNQPGRPGRLRLLVVPKRGAVSLDDRVLGNTVDGQPFDIEAEPGLHEVKIQRHGYHDHISRLRFESGVTREAVVSLTPQRRHTLPARQVPDLPPFGMVRGGLTRLDRRSADILAELGLDRSEAVPLAAGDRFELVDVGNADATFEIAAFGTKLNVRIVDDRGTKVAESLGGSWRPRIRFSAQADRRYFVALEPVQMIKNSWFDMVRYTATLAAVPKK